MVERLRREIDRKEDDHTHKWGPNLMFGQDTGMEQCGCGKYRRKQDERE